MSEMAEPEDGEATKPPDKKVPEAQESISHESRSENGAATSSSRSMSPEFMLHPADLSQSSSRQSLVNTTSSIRSVLQNVNDPEEFEKIQLLGRGDVGRVFLARHKGLDQLFGVKVMSKHEMKARNKVRIRSYFN